jgi:hypothetical protein
MHNTDQLFESIFKRNFRSVDTKAFLTALAKEYPYFTAAQFYLLKQSATNSVDFADQAAKTALLFNNPFWLNFQLTGEENTTFTSGEIVESIEANVGEKKEVEENMPAIAADEYTAVQPIQKNNEQENEIVLPVTSDETEITPSTLPIENNFYVETKEQDMLHAVPESMLHGEGTSINTDKEEYAPTLLENVSRMESTHEFVHTEDGTTQDGQPIETAVHHQYHEEKELTKSIEPTTAAIETTEESTTAKDNYHSGFDTLNNSPKPYIEKQAPPFITSTGNEETGEVDSEDIDSELDNSSEKEEPMNLKLNFDASATTTEGTISYQPLHTSDYFASLGIKLNENGLPVDRLGKQLKSFTDWLKVMKKIHPDQLPQTDELTEHTIQEIAEKSNKKGDILTEAMAEVLIQQGKTNKAIELYQKLSLLNPSKSAYFAAKIDNINR